MSSVEEHGSLEKGGGATPQGVWLNRKQMEVVRSLAQWSGRSVEECAEALDKGTLAGFIEEVRSVRGRLDIYDRLIRLAFMSPDPVTGMPPGIKL